MSKRNSAVLVFLGTLFALVAAQAHHSLSGVYNIRGSGEVTGVIKAVRFVNPHGVMELEVPNDDGTSTVWEMTTGSRNTLQSLGFGGDGPNTVIAGDVVTIRYFPAHNGKPLGFIQSITLPNQETIEFEIE
jgi:hypothetical protein